MLYCSGSMCVGVTVCFVWGDVVSLCRLKHYLLLNVFRMLVHPSSGTCDLCGFISWAVLLWFYVCWCYGMVRLGWCGILMQAETLFTAQRVLNVSTSIFRNLRLTVDLFHGLYCSGSLCVGVTVWFGWGGVVSLCRLKHYLLLNMFRMLVHPSS